MGARQFTQRNRWLWPLLVLSLASLTCNLPGRAPAAPEAERRS